MKIGASLLASIIIHMSIIVAYLHWDPPIAKQSMLIVQLLGKRTESSIAPRTNLDGKAPFLENTVSFPEKRPLNQQPDSFPKGISEITGKNLIKTIFGSKSLDLPLTPSPPPELEPPGGYSHNVRGSATLGLLIDENGIVRWLAVNESNLSPEINTHIAQSFAEVQFTPPTQRGKPVRVFLEIEVRINPE